MALRCENMPILVMFHRPALEPWEGLGEKKKKSPLSHPCCRWSRLRGRCASSLSPIIFVAFVMLRFNYLNQNPWFFFSASLQYWCWNAFSATAHPPTSVITMETRQSVVSQLSTVDQVSFPYINSNKLPLLFVLEGMYSNHTIMLLIKLFHIGPVTGQRSAVLVWGRRQAVTGPRSAVLVWGRRQAVTGQRSAVLVWGRRQAVTGPRSAVLVRGRRQAVTGPRSAVLVWGEGRQLQVQGLLYWSEAKGRQLQV